MKNQIHNLVYKITLSFTKIKSRNRLYKTVGGEQMGSVKIKAKDDCTNQTLARAFVPNQVICSIFEPSQALCNGTIFPELYQPFK
jgi:hypothetical protein